MTDTPGQPSFAKFEWADALPDPADNLDVLLAKYARLRFVYETKSQRYGRGLLRKDPAQNPAGGSVTYSPAALAPGAHSLPTDSPASQVAQQQPVCVPLSVGQSPQTVQAAASVECTDAKPVASPAFAAHLSQALQAAAPNDAAGSPDCRTPHHSMLPAPGAYMLHSGQNTHSKENRQPAGSGSILEDPIVATAWHSKKRNSKGGLNLRKPGSKTWTTLNLQQASARTCNPALKPQAPLPVGNAVPPRAHGPDRSVQACVTQQHSNAWSDADDIDTDPTPDKHSLSAQEPPAVLMRTRATHASAGHSGASAAQHTRIACSQTNAGNGFARPTVDQWTAQQAGPASLIAPTSPGKGSETQPELPMHAGNAQQTQSPELFAQRANTPKHPQHLEAHDTYMQSAELHDQASGLALPDSASVQFSGNSSKQQTQDPGLAMPDSGSVQFSGNSSKQQTQDPGLALPDSGSEQFSGNCSKQQTQDPGLALPDSRNEQSPGNSSNQQAQDPGLALPDSRSVQFSGNSSKHQSAINAKPGMPEGAAVSKPYSNQCQQGLHIQMDRPVQVLMSLGRYVAAVLGSSEQPMYQLVVFDVDQHQDAPAVVCAPKLHAAQLQPEPWQLGNCMQLHLVRDQPVIVMSSLLQPEGQESLQLNGINAWQFERQQAELACHLETQLTAYCVLASDGIIAAAGEGAWARLWQLDPQLVCQGQTKLQQAKYMRLAFPDIVQLAFADSGQQLIAGCSSTGLLAIWSIRGELLMAHCHPLLMVQSIYQPPDAHIAAQPHAPAVVVLLAKVQQHPNSQQHSKGPTQALAAVVVTQENVYVGASMTNQDGLLAPKVAGTWALSCCEPCHPIVWDMQQAALGTEMILPDTARTVSFATSSCKSNETLCCVGTDHALYLQNIVH